MSYFEHEVMRMLINIQADLAEIKSRFDSPDKILNQLKQNDKIQSKNDTWWREDAIKARPSGTQPLITSNDTTTEQETETP